MTCNFVTAIQELAKGGKRITYVCNDKIISLTYDPEEEQFYDKDGNEVHNVSFPVNRTFKIHSNLLREKEESYLKGFVDGLDPKVGIAYSEVNVVAFADKLKLVVDEVWEYEIYYSAIGSNCGRLERGKTYKLGELLL